MGIVPFLWYNGIPRAKPDEYHIIPHKAYTLENHSTADLYYDATNQTLGSAFPALLYYAAGVYCHTP